jgi:hypothetical protein
MRKSLVKKAAIVAAIAAVATAAFAGTAFAAPVLQPGVTSAPGMSGVCTDCHTYAKPAVAKPAATPMMFSRVMLKRSSVVRGRNFAATGYFSPTLAGATNATVTIGVERRGPRGRWVATRAYNETATLSATGKYAGQISYSATMNINRLGRYRLRAKLVYLGADSVVHTKWSKPTTVVIKKK